MSGGNMRGILFNPRQLGGDYDIPKVWSIEAETQSFVPRIAQLYETEKPAFRVVTLNSPNFWYKGGIEDDSTTTINITDDQPKPMAIGGRTNVRCMQYVSHEKLIRYL